MSIESETKQISKLSNNPIEPVGSVAPKVNLADELSIARVQFGQSLSIACPAQSFPVPAFR